MPYMIRRGRPEDGPAVLNVFNHFTETSYAAYPARALPEGAFDNWCGMARQNMTLVVETGEGIMGFAMLKPTAPFSTFNRSAEVAYFILPGHEGKGLGTQLLTRLENDARSIGVRTLLASISSLNQQSLSFHLSRGFSECGRWAMAAEKMGMCFDVVWMQKNLGE
jgi:L-amino acid N-acyltransferase YncA